MKRSFDFAFSFFLLVVLSPLFAGIALLVKMSSAGPVIFKQKRMGYRQKVFTIYKFRTMEDGSGRPMESIKRDDSRVTRVGTYLRSSYMDELPQLVNILKGEMSFVGPRPSSIEISKAKMLGVPGFARRFSVLPGLTGPLQLLGREAVLKKGCRETLAEELHYIESRSFFSDLCIICKTIPKVLKRQGV